MMRTAFRHKIIDGDALAMLKWIPKRVGRGRARYATAVALIDPDRMSNPQLVFDQAAMRGGVMIDDDGAAVGYYIRRAHQGDWFAAVKSMTWDFVPRETEWGRAHVVHDFDTDRAGQHRGGAGIFAPIMQRLKMLTKYDSTELDAAIVNSIFAAYVESPYDHDTVRNALDGRDDLGAYTEMRGEFHKDDGDEMLLGDTRIPSLFPGERINTVVANRPGGNYAMFESAVLRNVAMGLGVTAQQVTGNYGEVNYSSFRGALVEAHKTMSRRTEEFARGFVGPIRQAWMEEAMEVDEWPLPQGAPPFMEARHAYARARWMGPPIGWVDPVAEKSRRYPRNGWSAIDIRA